MARIASILLRGDARFGLCDWAGCAAKRANPYLAVRTSKLFTPCSITIFVKYYKVSTVQ